MEKKKPYRINLIHKGTDPQAVINKLVKAEWSKILDKNGMIAHNLDEVLNKHTSGEMCNDH